MMMMMINMLVVPIYIFGHNWDRLEPRNHQAASLPMEFNFELFRPSADGDPLVSRDFLRAKIQRKESHWIHCQSYVMSGGQSPEHWYRVAVGNTWVKQVPGSYFQRLSTFHSMPNWNDSSQSSDAHVWSCFLVGPTGTTQDDPTLVLSAFLEELFSLGLQVRLPREKW